MESYILNHFVDALELAVLRGFWTLGVKSIIKSFIIEHFDSFSARVPVTRPSGAQRPSMNGDREGRTRTNEDERREVLGFRV